MYTFPPVTDRIARMRKRYRDELPSFDCERVRIVTEYYRESEYEVPIIRRARALYKILSGVPLRIEPDELLVGNTGKYYKGAMLFPEYSGIQWLPRELKNGKFDQRTLQEAKCYMAQEDRDYVCSVADYWKDHCIGAMTRVEMPEEFQTIGAAGVIPYGPQARNETHGHYNANYHRQARRWKAAA